MYSTLIIISLEKILLILLLLATGSGLIHGQGCSDAGICTLPGVHETKTKELLQTSPGSITFGMGYGIADHDIMAVINYLEYSRMLNEKVELGARINSIYYDGAKINLFGFSDIFLTSKFSINNKLRFTGGLKIPLSDANKYYEGRPLPMDYQPSLGTIDLLLSGGITFRRMDIVLALQQPVVQNKNSFVAESFSAEHEFRNFITTNGFHRSGDLVIKSTYTIVKKPKLAFGAGILPVFHLGNDTFIDSSGIRSEINGSEGLTLNMTGFLDYAINKSGRILIHFGAPLIARDKRPDGLTRSFVLGLSYTFHFSRPG